MIAPFEFSEVYDNDHIFSKFPNLKVTSSSPAFYLLLRGMTGNLKIKQTFNDFSFNQTYNLLNPLDVAENSSKVENKKNVDDELKMELGNLFAVLITKCKSNLDLLPDYISDSFTLEDLSKVLSDKRVINRNKDFFETLNSEFCNYYYNSAKGCHTVAYIHLYRILEYVSYTFPVIYATATKDFSKSFGMLKGLFNGDKDQGELNVFKYFIESVMSEEKDYKRLSIDINITSDLNEYNERIYKTITNICDNSFFSEGKNIEYSKIVVKFSEFSSFMITIRNRFYHLRNSQSNNIRSVDIVDSDFFFSLINRKCAYFLSLVTFVVIKNAYLKD